MWSGNSVTKPTPFAFFVSPSAPRFIRLFAVFFILRGEQEGDEGYYPSGVGLVVTGAFDSFLSIEKHTPTSGSNAMLK